MERRDICALRLIVEPVNFSGNLTIEADLDSSLPHYMWKKNSWRHKSSQTENDIGTLHAETITTKFHVAGHQTVNKKTITCFHT